ncbi:hypothetical protein EXIGLDRAFT_844184 [Exidia glandulosa HHB12029]|uniref:CxC2-like cysteine cluster KDZ transposase-associated domain-containing protein n=1 Tax=Exidia glandulosa HHB12029 TaxID=1314781 RepID=A0A165C720_EXIGL|nr:hypothetical protein EXIGLDRAFT_844184 [Exidia glandulosa HHB12029]
MPPRGKPKEGSSGTFIFVDKRGRSLSDSSADSSEDAQPTLKMTSHVHKRSRMDSSVSVMSFTVPDDDNDSDDEPDHPLRSVGQPGPVPAASIPPAAAPPEPVTMVGIAHVDRPSGRTRARHLFHTIAASVDSDTQPGESNDTYIPETMFWDDAEALTLQVPPILRAGKRVRSQAGDYPMRDWTEIISAVAEELMKHELPSSSVLCTACGTDVSTAGSAYRCLDCFTASSWCRTCLVERHAELPFHRVQLWNGSFFATTSLKDAGLVLDVFHKGCPGRSPSDFVVVDALHIHRIAISFCRCGTAPAHWRQLLSAGLFPATPKDPHTAFTFRLLDLFRMLNLEARANAYDVMFAIRRLTDNVIPDKTSDRYAAFLNVTRLWGYLGMLRRSGAVHQQDQAPPGDIAVVCPACPRPHINLPRNWHSAPAGERYLYNLILMFDGNFKLKRKKKRSNDVLDPGLGTGRAYFVEQHQYAQFVSTLPVQAQEPTCSGFRVASLANKGADGLDVTGVVGGVCRHCFVQANGVADLQRGESYAHMDYAIASALRQHLLPPRLSIQEIPIPPHQHRIPSPTLDVTLSYDVVCQWLINFEKRRRSWPAHLALPEFRCTGAIGKLHLPAHQKACQSKYSLNFLPGVGRTDGEGIERQWGGVNPAAPSTKEMGPGARHDALDLHWSHWNWKKLTGLGEHLAESLRKAVASEAQATCAFDAFDETVGERSVAWAMELEAWEADPGTACPFELREKRTSTKDIRLAMSREEAQGAEAHDHADDDQGDGTQVSPSAFLLMAFDIENVQRGVLLDARVKGDGTTVQQQELLDARTALRRKINQFRVHQAHHMPRAPSAVQVRDAAQCSPEDEPLFLPSAFSAPDRVTHDLSDLSEKEARLREGHAADALADLRRHMRMHSHLVLYKRKNAIGQREGTRAMQLKQTIRLRMDDAAARYRVARLALIHLGREPLRELKAADMVTIGNWAFSDELEPGEKQRELPWIWSTAGVTGEMDQSVVLEDELRIEWLRCKARSQRWKEEIALCREEMRRTSVSLSHEGRLWAQRASSALGGHAAYALRQQAVHVRLREYFEGLWSGFGILYSNDGRT